MSRSCSDKIREKIRSRFTREEIKLYKKQFDTFDLNGDGVISGKELEKVSKHLGYKLTKKDIKEIMKAIDLDDSGTLSFDEFLMAMPGNGRIAAEDHKAAEIRRKFMEYDRDRNGHVTVEEAHDILRRELAFTPQQSVQLVDKYDKNRDGQLSYDEFVNFYKRVHAKARQVRQMFYEFDRDNSGAVSVEEVKFMLRKLHIPDAEVEGLVAIHDRNRDGELQYEEFVSFLMHS